MKNSNTLYFRDENGEEFFRDWDDGSWYSMREIRREIRSLAGTLGHLRGKRRKLRLLLSVPDCPNYAALMQQLDATDNLIHSFTMQLERLKNKLN